MHRHTPTKFHQKPQSRTNISWERKELKRLLWALMLFLTVFLGKKIYPDRMLTVGEEIISVLGSNTDMGAIFSRLGNSINTPKGVMQGLEAFCVEVFGPQKTQDAPVVKPTPPSLPKSPVGLLSSNLAIQTALCTTPLSECHTDPQPAVPAVGTVLTIGELPEGDLPDGYTVDELSFGDLETVTPVMGIVTSAYGYRDHPISGKYLFHGGIDIGADAGTLIAAFADGQVEYIGEDNSYGLYLQLDHGNGIKSFYAHCQRICVRKGQQVQAGEAVGMVGTTGTTTGPHLHLELKCGDVRVDPAYYLPAITTS